MPDNLYYFLVIKANLVELQMKGLVTETRIAEAVDHLDNCVERYKRLTPTKITLSNDLAKYVRILLKDDLFYDFPNVVEQIVEFEKMVMSLI